MKMIANLLFNFIIKFAILLSFENNCESTFQLNATKYNFSIFEKTF